MNKAVLCGRLTKDPTVRVSGDNKVANYSLAVDRRTKDKQADFIPCVVFGKGAEFAEKYLHKGSKIIVSGRIQTGSYEGKDGKRVYTMDVIVEEQEFAESKQATQQAAVNGEAMGVNDMGGFMNIPDGIEEELPFK